jgi:hypothetical protein
MVHTDVYSNHVRKLYLIITNVKKYLHPKMCALLMTYQAKELFY